MLVKAMRKMNHRGALNQRNFISSWALFPFSSIAPLSIETENVVDKYTQNKKLIKLQFSFT